MAGYIGSKAVSVNTTSATISDDLAVGDDLTVTDDATIGGTALVTGVLTTTAATVFNGGFASNADSTMGTDKKLIFRDSAIHISSTADGDMSIAADDEIDITSTLIDINGNVEIGGTIDATTSASDAYFFRGSHATTTAFYITNTNATTNNVANLILAPANNVAGAYLSAIATEDFSVSGNRTADLAFYTRLNGTFSEQLRIDSSGNVGVNTASPDAIFTVDTNVGGSSTGTLARFHASKGESDSTYLQIAATRHGTASVQRVQLQAFDDDGSTGRTLSLNGSGGNVGIGTHEPDTLLQLSTATGPVLRFERNDTSITSGDLYGSIEFEGQDGSSSSAGVRAEIRVEGAGTGTQGETSILFKTSHTATTRNTEKMKIGNLGDVTVTSGNLVIGTQDKGIDFSAQTATSASGASTVNELLNHYEDGSFTPIITDNSDRSGTQAYQVGRYIRVGRVVHVQGRVSISSLASMSGTVKIKGFPFTSINVANCFSVLNVGVAGGLAITAGESISGTFDVNGSAVFMRIFDDAAGTTTLTTAELSADGDFIFAGSYIAN